MFFIKCIHTLFFALFIAKCSADCTVPISSLIDILPVDKSRNILYPNDNLGNIVTKNGNSIYLACPGDQIILKKNKKVTFNVETTEFVCKNKVYENQKIKYNIDELTCDALKPVERLEKRKGFCESKNTHISRVVIGFQFKDNTLLPQIEVCWDNQKKTPLYALANMKFIQNGCRAQAERVTFRPGKLFEESLSKYYTRHFQMYNLCVTYKSIPPFITPEVVDKSLLDRGHLVAKCDFAHDAQQRLTFQYTNVGPQWGSFNQQNWALLEGQVRNFIVTGQNDLYVFTGTSGIFQINNKDYYLYGPKSQIPVPKYFWKIVLKQTGATTYGVAVLGLNDIFVRPATDPCKNVLSSVKWLNLPNWNNVQSGYVIACEIKDFEKIPEMIGMIPELPKIDGLLK